MKLSLKLGSFYLAYIKSLCHVNYSKQCKYKWDDKEN